MSDTQHVNGRPTARGARRLLTIALATAAAGTGFAWLAAPPGTRFAPGIAILAVAALLVAVTASRVAVVIATVAASLMLLRLVGDTAVADLTGARGVAVAVSRWLQATGVVVALGAAIRLLLTRGRRRGRTGDVRQATGRRRSRRIRWGQVVALLVLSAICAELLQAYDDSTGRPLELLFAVVFFAPLYGGPALLLREVARRTGRGWPSMLLIATAFAIIQPGVIDQSMFSDSYRDIAGWEASLRATYIGALGLSAFLTQSFVVGHIIYSFCAPIAVVEAMRPASARTPWLGPGGLAVVALLYLAVAAAVLGEHLATESSHATPAQVAGTLVVAAALAAWALTIKPHSEGAPEGTRLPRLARAPSVRGTLVAGLILASLHTAAPETWAGVALAVAVLAVGGVLLLRASRSPGWGVAHAAAAACGVLLSRALLAFTYFPVVGDVSPVRKYTHNVVMLALVTAVGWYTLRRATTDRAQAVDQPASPPGDAGARRHGVSPPPPAGDPSTRT